MKKTIKLVSLLVVMVILLAVLTGCGGNKLVATKTVEDDGSGMGKYEEKVEIIFKDDKASEIIMTSEFEKEEIAESMAEIFKIAETEGMEGFKVEQDGKKVIIKMDANTFAEQEGTPEEKMTKEAMKKALEEDGYKVK